MLRAPFILLIFTLAFLISDHALALDVKVSEEIAYILVDYEHRIERYDLENRNWLSSISLTDARGAPATFHVDPEGLYVAWGNLLYRYDLTGDGEVEVANTSNPIGDVLSSGNLLFWRSHTLFNNDVEMHSIDKTNNTIIDTINPSPSFTVPTIAPSHNRILARTTNRTPSDLIYIDYSDEGIFIGDDDSPHHGDYPDAFQAWVFPDDSRVIDSSGSIYSATSLRFLGAINRNVDDIAFVRDDTPIIRSGATLVAYSNGLTPTGSVQLSYHPDKFVINNDDVILFTHDVELANKVRVDSIPTTSLGVDSTSPPLDISGSVFLPGDIFQGSDGLSYLVSRMHRSIIPWNPSSQSFGSPIAMSGAPSLVTYSPEDHRFYLLYKDGIIRRIDLDENPLQEVDFTILEAPPIQMATAGTFLFVSYKVSTTDEWRTIDRDGNLVEINPWNRSDDADEFVWNDANQKMYYINRGSPRDLNWVELNADGSTYPMEPAGGFRAGLDSPLHNSAGFDNPVRVSPDGATVLLGSGVIHDATTLERSATQLPFPINDAIWLGANAFTTRGNSGTSALEKWNGTSYSQLLTANFDGVPHRIIPVSGTQFLNTSFDAKGILSLTLVNDSLEIIPPSSLQNPFNLSLAVVSPTELELTWVDTTGEYQYSIERKIGTGGAWMPLATTQTNASSYRDATVVVDETYSYRITGENGILSSIPSDEVSLEFSVPDPPSGLLGSTTRSGDLQISWQPSPRATQYQLERQLGLGSWINFGTVEAGNTTIIYGLVNANFTYPIRVIAENGLGQAESFPEIEVTVDPDNGESPESPTLSTTGSSATSVQLNWTSVLNESHFILERRLSTSSTWSPIATVARNQQSYTDATVSALTSYHYRIEARNNLHSMIYSNQISVTTPNFPPPASPEQLSARLLTSNSTQLNWLDPDGETSLTIQRSLSSSDSWIDLVTLPADTTSYLDSPLAQGVTHHYRILASNSFGASDPSNSDQVTPYQFNRILTDDFDPSIDDSLWTDLSGGNAIRGDQGFRDGNALWFGGSGTRQAQTAPLDIRWGGELVFFIRAGNQAVDGNTYWDNSEFFDDVVLEFSTDGSNWSQIQTLESTYPSLSSWEKMTVSIPSGAVSSSTSFRWRQLSNSGTNLDTWALDDVWVNALPTPLPSQPESLMLQTSSSRQIEVSWGTATYAATYVLERSTDQSVWEAIGEPSTTTTFSDSNLTPGTLYFYRVKARNISGDSTYSELTSARTLSQLDEWRTAHFGQLDDTGTAAADYVDSFGVSNLIRFASNLGPDDNATPIDSDNGSHGLPNFYYEDTSKRLRVTFVRRKAASSPGITYTIEFGDDLIDLSEDGQLVSATSINEVFERVVWEDSTSSDSVARRFGRVHVSVIEN